MKNWMREVWRDPVWSKVIAGVVLAGLSAVYGYAERALPGAGAGVNVFKSYLVPLSIIFVAFAWAVLSRVKAKREAKRKEKIDNLVSVCTKSPAKKAILLKGGATKTDISRLGHSQQFGNAITELEAEGVLERQSDGSLLLSRLGHDVAARLS